MPESEFFISFWLVLTDMLSAITDTALHHCQLLMGVIRAGSGSLWPQTTLFGSQCCRTTLSWGPSGNSWEATPSTPISCQRWHRLPFFCLPAYQQRFVSADTLPPSGRWEKAALKAQGEAEPVPPPLRTVVITGPLPFPRRDVASSSLSHALQAAHPSSSAWGQSSSVPSSPLHSKQQGWLQRFTSVAVRAVATCAKLRSPLIGT